MSEEAEPRTAICSLLRLQGPPVPSPWPSCRACSVCVCVCLKATQTLWRRAPLNQHPTLEATPPPRHLAMTPRRTICLENETGAFKTLQEEEGKNRKCRK